MMIVVEIRNGRTKGTKGMDVLVIDFETYYDKQYGFNKLTTEEYVRDDRFEVIGVAVKRNYEPTQWFSGTFKKTQDFLDTFDWANSIAVAHNAKFDMAVLNWLFTIRPKKIADTLSMARSIHTVEVGGSLSALSEYYELGKKGTEVVDNIGKRRLDFSPSELEQYGKYCIQDVELTHKLFLILMKKLDFNIFELNLIDLTLRMFTEPRLVLDKSILQDHLDEIKMKKQELMEKVRHEETQLRSNPQFADLLKEFGVEPPMKVSPTTGKETYAFAKTDEEFRALLEHENDYVQALVAARLGVRSTIEETRTERFMAIADRGPLPIPLRYYAAHTGRWGGDEKINMQNLPRGSALKKAICAPEGYVFIDCDLSQIEARTLAWLAEQNDLVDAFARGDDVYSIMASNIYYKPVDQITKEERFVGKTTILGAGYGMGAQKFQLQLKNFGVELELEECERIIKVYRKTYSRIPKLWYQANDALKAIMKNHTSPLGKDGVLQVTGHKGIVMPNGLSIKYPNLRQSDDELVYDTRRGRAVIANRIYGGKVIENVCQALARIVIGEQLLRVSKRYKVVMTVHDAIGCIALESEADRAMAYVEECMKICPEWAEGLPLDCEGGYAKSYGEC